MNPDTHSKPRKSAALEVRNLSVAFADGRRVVDGIDLSIEPGQILCLIGESGSGKSVTAWALMRLPPHGAMDSAAVLRLEETDLLSATSRDLERLRGNRIAIVSQDASLSLNPVVRIGDQIAEVLQTHRSVSRQDARRAVLSMLDSVHMPGGAERFGLFAHQMSGGMRQRALIAMALISRPAVLIADEPTSALDALVQRQIIRLIGELRAEFGTAVLLISHDLRLVDEVADRIAVIFAGQIVESGYKPDVISDPMHPYTLALLAASLPQNPVGVFSRGGVSLATRPDRGCVFQHRCPVVIARCQAERPPLVAISATHNVACWRAPLEVTLT